jgi:hypothetical protein
MPIRVFTLRTIPAHRVHAGIESYLAICHAEAPVPAALFPIATLRSDTPVMLRGKRSIAALISSSPSLSGVY